MQIEWSKARPSAILGGVLAALLSGLLPLPVIFIFLWMLVGGAFAAMMYQRRVHGAVTPGMGARIGGAAGGVGFTLFAILTVLDLMVMGMGKLRAAMAEAVQQAAARNPDPRTQELMQRMTSAEGIAILVTLSVVMFLVAFIGLSSLGGAIGASWFGRRDSHRF